MSYLSIKFIVLVSITFFLLIIFPQKYRPAVLLGASLYFYAMNSKYLVVVVSLLSLSVYLACILMSKKDELFQQKKKELEKDERKELKKQIKKQKKRILVVECIIAFGMLVCFKYLGFFTQIFNSITEAVFDFGFSIPKIIVPLGISYYTLSLVGYATDVYRSTAKAEKSFINLLLFSVYFPHIVEGPIASYKSFSEQLSDMKIVSFDEFMRAVERILLGLIKKMIIADRAAIVANIVFDNSDRYHSLSSLVGIVMYVIYIYFDFSGCIDLVSGVSELFGIKLAQNFRHPFFSKSVQEFWRRWHITLGDWIKNYIFYPMSLSKVNKNVSAFLGKHIKNNYLQTTLQMLFPLLFVWLFTGIWHGSSWKYVLYGLYYYLILSGGLLLEPVFERLCKKLHINRKSTGYSVFQIIRTSLLVAVGLTLFRADNTLQAVKIVLSVFNSGGMTEFSELYSEAALSALDYVVIALFTLFMAFISYKEERGTDIYDVLQKHKVLRWICCTAAMIAVLALGVYGVAYTAQPFVYAQF